VGAAVAVGVGVGVGIAVTRPRFDATISDVNLGLRAAVRF
jgi:hypothetical protein